MGDYYTYHKLQIIPENNEIYQEFLNNTKFIEDDSCGWWDCEDDCINISEKNKGYLIVVTGEGYGAFFLGDIWKKAFLNGYVVWEWELNLTIPEVPEEILQKAGKDFEAFQLSNVEKKIKQLEEEQLKLKKLLLDYKL
jgi:hypothetical protein